MVTDSASLVLELPQYCSVLSKILEGRPNNSIMLGILSDWLMLTPWNTPSIPSSPVRQITQQRASTIASWRAAALIFSNLRSCPLTLLNHKTFAIHPLLFSTAKLISGHIGIVNELSFFDADT